MQIGVQIEVDFRREQSTHVFQPTAREPTNDQGA
jgi:hypothetical protein